MFGNLINWEKWPLTLTIHSAFWGILFNSISAVVISFITQDTKENNHKNKIHEFFDDHRNLSMADVKKIKINPIKKEENQTC